MKAKVPEQITLASHHERVEYLDMVVLMALHNTFGFGQKRMRRVIRSLKETHNHYLIYLDHHDPKFGSRTKDGMERSDLWTAKRDLRQLGYDWDEETREARG